MSRIALVIGGASGIGLAIGRRLGRDGATVFLSSRRGEDADRAAHEIGHGAQGLTGDAGKPEDVDGIVEAVRSAAGRIDALVINAGVAEMAPIEAMTPDHIERVLAVNAAGPANVMRAAVPMMSSGGAIVLVSSVAASRGSPGNGTYSASKAALTAYGRTWAAELGARGIRVNIVTPGPTETAMFAEAPAEMKQAIAARIPLGRMGQPDDVAAAAAFLLGDEARYITGADLAVDGGLLAT